MCMDSEEFVRRIHMGSNAGSFFPFADCGHDPLPSKGLGEYCSMLGKEEEGGGGGKRQKAKGREK